LCRGYLPFFSGYAMASFLETRKVHRRDLKHLRADPGPRAADGGARGFSFQQVPGIAAQL
jgi:hypothetical protein